MIKLTRATAKRIGHKSVGIEWRVLSYIFLLGFAVICGILATLVWHTIFPPTANVAAEQTTTKPVSRQWVEYAESIIRHETKTPPTASARFYAYIASGYAEGLQQTHDTAQASRVAAALINQFYPVYRQDTATALVDITPGTVPAMNNQAKGVYEGLLYRSKHDGFSLVGGDKRPGTEAQYWHPDPYPPVTPRAGDWQTWLVGDVTNYPVPPPPAYGSESDVGELQKVADAVKHRSLQDSKDIQFWNAGAGTDAPAGLWQDVMFKKTSPTDDATYARQQKYLAQGIADAFIACWHTKYTYWTARPSQRIPDLETAFLNPSFPSYVSGHATISSTAAVILSHEFPRYAEFWQQSAARATKSRLTAGIHFDIDNTAGNTLGEAIGTAVVAKIDQ